MAPAQRKLDKLNLLCYCSGLAFVLTFPIWLWTDALPLYSAPLSLTPQSIPSPSHSHASSMYLPLEFFFNGIFHFTQNLLAFILLSLVSPVTYSVASLIKRVFVIVIAIIWFGNSTTSLQAAGIALTFLGLYLYDRTSNSAKSKRRARMEAMSIEKPLLPLSNKDAIHNDPPISTFSSNIFGNVNGHVIGDGEKTDAVGPGRPRARSQVGGSWRAPGTRQQETWKPRDLDSDSNAG